MSGERQVPFYCPYCGEETLRPAGPDAGAWECGACSRGFQLRFVAVLRPQAVREPAAGFGSPAGLRPAVREPGMAS